jgi:hypothetical protein
LTGLHIVPEIVSMIRSSGTSCTTHSSRGLSRDTHLPVAAS